VQTAPCVHFGCVWVFPVPNIHLTRLNYAVQPQNCMKVCTEDDSRIGIGGCNKGLMDAQKAQKEGEKRPSNRPLKREAQLLAQPRILTQTCMVDGHRSQNKMPARRCCGYRCISVQARLSSLFPLLSAAQATAVFPHAMPASWTLPKTPTIPRYTSYGILEISRRADDLNLLG